MSEDLISREKAYEVLSEYYHHKAEVQHKALRVALDMVPSADIPDRKVGKWMLVEYPDGHYHAECSECGEEYAEDLYWHKKARFCPCCGAELRGSENE